MNLFCGSNLNRVLYNARSFFAIDQKLVHSYLQYTMNHYWQFTSPNRVAYVHDYDEPGLTSITGQYNIRTPECTVLQNTPDTEVHAKFFHTFAFKLILNCFIIVFLLDLGERVVA